MPNYFYKGERIQRTAGEVLKNLARFVLLKSLSYVIKGNGVLERKRNKKQWVYDKNKPLGGKIERPTYFPNGVQESDLGTMESQAITAKDFWTCVSNSYCRVIQIQLEALAKLDLEIKKGLEDLGFYDENGHVNISQRALAVMSGTVPGRGNSQYKVAETARKYGLVSEKFCSTLPGMTQWEFFNLPAGTYAQAKKFLELCDLFHEDIDEITPELFTHGAIQAAVASPYNFNGNVVVPPSVYNYNHAITPYGKSDFVKVCDSYPEFLKNFSLNYKFRTPKIIFAQKKTSVLSHQIIGCNGGIYFLAKAGNWKGNYLGYENGEVYKALMGEYRDVKRVEVMKLPSNMARTDEGYIVKYTFMHDFNIDGGEERGTVTLIQ